MPRGKLERPIELERLEILSADGSLDEEHFPDWEPERIRELHRTMLLSRRFDERLLQLQKQGRIGTFAPAIGQEAAQVGAAAALRDDDWLVPSYRDSAALIWRGVPLEGLILYDAGWNEGAAPPEESHDLPIAVPVASQIPIASGIGYAAKLAGSEEVTLVMFGDGATSEGDFHEAVNFAAVHALPVIFLCQNNQYAISTPIELQTHSPSIAHKAVAYGMRGIQVDGNDLFAVAVACREAVDRARSGDGPTLVEAVTYRLSVHTTADDPSAYREEDEEQQWREKEPLDRLQRFMRDREWLSKENLEQLEGEIDSQIEQAWEAAEGQMDSFDPLEPMFEHIYAELPEYVAEQKDWLISSRQESAENGGRDG